MTARVLIADDHGAIREGLRLMLEAGGLVVVGEAADGETAVSQARLLRPDVVLMDVRMPGTDGIEATRRIVDEGLADVLMLTTFDVDEYVFGAVRAGAAGFLLKSTDAASLIEAVTRVAAGDAVLAPEVTRRMLAQFVRQAPAPAAPPPGFDELSAREREVLGCLGEGLSNAEIASRLTISSATAKTHVSRVLAKLGSTSRMQAAVIARETNSHSSPQESAI